MKRILTFLFVFSLLVILAIPCFASYDFSYIFPLIPPDDSIFESEDAIIDYFSVSSYPSPGNYTYNLTLKIYGFTYNFSGVCTVYDFGGSYMIPFSLQTPGSTFTFNLLWSFSDDVCLFFVADSSGEDIIFTFEGSEITLSKIINKDFVTSVNDGLSNVLTWVSSVTSSLLSGSMSPLFLLLCVAIAISLIFVAIKFIFISSWGS